MKNAILTFHRAPNYGAVLQAYAIYRSLNKYSDVMLLDYIPEESKPQNKQFLRFIKTPLRKYRESLFFALIKKKCKMTKKLNSPQKFINEANNFDNVVVGSDQVWNKDLTNNSEAVYLLSYPLKANKYSYAASLGKEELPKEELTSIKNALKDFKGVSVRESSAQDILGEGDVSLDPTLLLTREEWVADLDLRKTNERYIYAYMLGHNEDLIKSIELVSKELGLKVKSNKYYHPQTKKYGRIKTMKTENFLNELMNAKFIVTNSFHGTVFSIIFGKKFITIPHQTRSIRQKELLEKLALNSRLHKYDEELIKKDIKEDIDYPSVYKKLADLRQDSLNYIEKIVK